MSDSIPVDAKETLTDFMSQSTFSKKWENETISFDDLSLVVFE